MLNIQSSLSAGELWLLRDLPPMGIHDGFESLLLQRRNSRSKSSFKCAGIVGDHIPLFDTLFLHPKTSK